MAHNSNNANQTVINQFPILGLLGLIFVIAKITGYITWSWWLVTLPFWIGPAIVLGILVLGAIMIAIAWIIDALSGR